MSITRCRHLALLILGGCLSAIPLSYGSTVDVPTPQPTPEQVQPPSNAPYPQIVRLSYVEGDVRIARGKRGAGWETAVADLPLETGFNLVTGNGRAEIEFEDASTIYLGENSALTFNDLHTTAGVPHTELALLAGTATLHIYPAVAGESFSLNTPAHLLFLSYPDHVYERVSSYLDGMVITPLEPRNSHLPGGQPTQPLATTYSQFSSVSEPSDPHAFAEWDNWVATRVAARAAAMTAMMEASGLTSPLPGLADMKGQGTFFPCAPYGTCWAPNLAAPETASEFHAASQAPVAPSQQSSPAARMAGPTPITATQRNAVFPCSPSNIRSLVTRNPATGKQQAIYSASNATAAPYDWAVCHAGSWIYHDHRYAWVAGTRRHHHCPVHWVKTGRSVAYVPIHPRDVPGKLPINREHGLFALHDRQGHSVEWVNVHQESQLKLLDTPPKQFRAAVSPVLSRAANPRVEAHRVGETPSSRKDVVARDAGTRLTFNPKSQSFMIDRHAMLGAKSYPERTTFNNRMGTLQARAGSVDAHGNYSTHAGGGSSRSSGGGNSGGSSGHSGGSSSNSSGGGGHSGGSSSSSSGGGGGHR